MYLVDEVLVVVVPHLDLLIVPVLEVGLAPVGVGLQPQALALVRLALQAAVRTQPPQLATDQSEVSTAESRPITAHLVVLVHLVRHPHVVVVRLQRQHAAPVQRGLYVHPGVCKSGSSWQGATFKFSRFSLVSSMVS